MRRSEGAVVEVVPLVDDDSYVCRYASDPEDVDDDSRGAETEEDDPHGDGGVNVLDVDDDSRGAETEEDDPHGDGGVNVLDVVSSDVLDVVSSCSSSSSAPQSNVVVAPDEYDDEYVDDVPL